MRVEEFLDALGADFYAGVPDSLLKSLCGELMRRYGEGNRHHVIAANEGNALALAAGYHLATGKVGVVYLQNSGEGNLANPLCSLTHPAVYGIPVLLVIGWRGEPGLKDEPQHAFQGQITCEFMESLGVECRVVDDSTTKAELTMTLKSWQSLFAQGRSAALVVRKNALEGGDWQSGPVSDDVQLTREQALGMLLEYMGESDIIVSTTGKTSRELFELREARQEGHQRDFLTVGSMGHASSIALGLALQHPKRQIWCLDGDGAALMHLGALAVIARCAPPNLVHVVFNNGVHESVGGFPTAAHTLDLAMVAKELGYQAVCCTSRPHTLTEALAELGSTEKPTFIEVVCKPGSRKDLGRPTSSPGQNKEALMAYLQG